MSPSIPKLRAGADAHAAQRKRRLYRALVLSAQLLLAGCGASATGDPGGGDTPKPPSVTAVVIAPTTLTLTAGELGSLTATLSTTGDAPAGGWTTTWQSSDASIVAVSSSGTLTALSAGSATITATSGGKSASVIVTVRPNVSSIDISISISSFVAVGFTRTLSARINSPSPAPAGGWNVGWTTSDPAIATVAQTGVVTAVAPGTATITATLGDKSTSVPVQVLPQPGLVGLDLNADDVSLQETDEVELNAQATLVGTIPAGGLVFTWTSSNPSVASVLGSGENGLVTAVAVGTAKITVAAYGKTSSVDVTVRPKVIVPPPPPGTVSAISLNNPVVVIKPGADYPVLAQVTASVAPPRGDWPVTWTTGDPAVATISESSGTYARVAAVGIGKTTLTAALQGKSASADVYVANLTSFVLSPATLSIPMGEQRTLTTTSTTTGPLPPTGWPMSWTSSSPFVATVSPTGVVNAIGVGKTRIGVSASDKYQTAVITVTGTPPTLTLSTPDPLKGEIISTTAGYILQCVHTIKVTVSGPGVVVGTEVYESIGGGPYEWTGASSWGQYAEGVPAKDLVKLNGSGPVASPSLLTASTIGMQLHYVLNSSLFDVRTLATDYVATLKLVCEP